MKRVIERPRIIGAGISIAVALCVAGLASSASGTTGPGAGQVRSRPVHTTSSEEANPRLPGFLAQSVSFLNAEDGWVLGAARCTSGWCAALRRTTDGGHSWTSVPPPHAPLSRNSSEGVSELRFANGADGYAFDPGLWSTSDGGALWRRVNLHGSVLALASADGESYAVVAPCWAPSYHSCSTPTRLYRSVVGSNTWQEVSGVALPANQTSDDLVVRGPTVYLLPDGTTYLLESSSGVRFNRLRSPCPAHLDAGYHADAIAASSATELDLLCGDGVAAGSEEKKLYVSSNAGRTFRPIAAPPFTGDVEGGLAAGSPTTIAMTAVSGASWIYSTSGNDRTWSTSLTLGDAGFGFDDLSLVDASHGAVIHAPAIAILALKNVGGAAPPVRPGALYVTSDGGASWRPIDLAVLSPYPSTLKMWHGLEFPTTGHPLPWGTSLTAEQARTIRIRSSGRTFKWGVWMENGGPSQFPVRSTDGGAHWTAAGPQLATDWAGGGLFYVGKAFSEGSSSVVMVSNSIIDVSTDRGHQWYQYLNANANWVMTTYLVHGGGIGLRVSPTHNRSLPTGSWAIYVLSIAHHVWHRTRQSMR